jgi:hypothetical protein
MTAMEKVVIGNSVLYCGDCREIIGDLQFDSIVTDPPYGLAKLLNRSWDAFGKIWNKQQRRKNLHSGGTWAAKDIYQDVDWDNETPDLAFLLALNVPSMFFGGNYFANLPPSRKWIVWFKGATHFRRSFAELELCYCNFDGNARLIEHIPEFNRGFANNGSRMQKFTRHKSPLLLCGFVFRSCRRDVGTPFVILIWVAARRALRQSSWEEHSLESNKRKSISTSLARESSRRMPFTKTSFPKYGK